MLIFNHGKWDIRIGNPFDWELLEEVPCFCRREKLRLLGDLSLEELINRRRRSLMESVRS